MADTSSDESASSTDSKADRDFVTANKDPQFLENQMPPYHRGRGTRKNQYDNRQDWKKDFVTCLTRTFCFTRGEESGEDLSPTQTKEREDNKWDRDLYADDKGQGEIYEELDSDEELGFTGHVCKELNLMPFDSVTDLQTDGHIPEIVVVPSAQFVREISNGKK
ncbi:hypothetical protein OS493_010984 [Desmophyllum pertusum]|uniref:Uncharacterized protein n=1 Tax=Desmophyllum pertusum TaxID=174260 RepID=A0A9W9ZEI8_9CNID|nr:hypothetical protein OS493_010984 [Desmophyllum pertusum]